MNLFTDEMRRNPYPFYAKLRESSPLLHVPSVDLWLVLDYEGVKRALHDHECFGNDVSPARAVRFDWLLFMDPPRHTKLRALVSRAFTPGSIAELAPRIQQLASQLLDAACPRDHMDLCAEFAAPLPLMVIAELLGLRGDRWLQLQRWSEAIMNLSNTIMGTPEQSRAAEAAFVTANAEMKEVLMALLAARRAAPLDDLTSRLACAEVDGELLTEEEFLHFVQLLLAAGTETITNLIANSVISFLEHPDELARLRASPDLLPSAIEEVLRYRSPGQAVFRATRREVELHGQRIPAGKMVLALSGAANRDPQQFADPDRMDITRAKNPHFAFGHGIHFCLGAALSRLEARIALDELLRRLKHFALASDAPWPPRQAFHVHGPAALPIQFSC